MKKVLIFFIISLFLLNFISADLVPCGGDKQTTIFCDKTLSQTSSISTGSPAVTNYTALGIFVFFIILILVIIVMFIIKRKLKYIKTIN